MAYSLVTHTTSSAGAASSPSVDTSGANLLIGCVSATDPASGGSSMTPSDNKSNTWHEAAYIPGAFSGATKIYYAFNPTVGSGHTFTANGDLQSGCFMAWSGATTTDPLDQVSAGANSFSPLQPGSVTPSRDGALLVVAVGDVQTFPPVTDSGYTDLDCVITVGGVNYSSADAYFVQSVAAAINPTVTETGSMNLIQVSFLPAASATTHRTGLPLLGVG